MEWTGSAGSSQLVLADTSGLYALIVEHDHDHRTAQAIYRRLAADRRQLFTTNYLIAELHALMLTRVGRYQALNAVQSLLSGRINILRIRENEEQRALAILSTYRDKDFSFVDATSFAVMERLNVAMALTFDRHFVQFGYRALGLET